MADMGWSSFIKKQENAEYMKACEEQKRKEGLVVSKDTILNCIDCETGDCEI